MNNILKLGIPAGSLQEATGELFRKAGYKVTFASRSYYPTIDDPEIQCTLLRSQELPRYVQDGSLDCGLTGHDWVVENDAQVVELAELVFSKVSRRPVRWVLAVPNDSPIREPKDLQGKRIATEVVNITRRWLASHGVTGKVGLMMNVRKADVEKVLKVLPVTKPTVSGLSDPEWADVLVILDEDVVRRIIPELKRAGASSIVEFPLTKIID